MISYFKVDFAEIRRKNVHFFNLVHAHKPKFGLFFFLASFLSFLSALLFSLSFTLHILFSAVKSLVLIADEA